ncbi:fimbrial protein [Hafnia paralvei]|uniref:fimbrial protein n=1 Tax=Hafnia paralvei TaxID=546367 RepID=UPI000FB34966|nr:fimbrial protein [Hafnia paralvei]TBM07386.1 fimbrial protein [Hafnia paralvei]
MKKTTCVSKVLWCVLVLMGGSVYANSVFAGSAICEAINGSATSYENMIQRDLNSDDNATGKSFTESLNSSQQSYQITCDCSDADASSANGVLGIYSLKTSLPSGHISNYYKINDHLDLMTQITIPNNDDVTVPTTRAVSDRQHHRDKDGKGICKQQATQDNLTVGSQGKLTFYVTNPFVGELTIPRTEIARIYASSSSSTDTNPPLGSPVAIVYISGTVTVPQSCEINQGEIISVDFGNIEASNFTKINQPPTGYAPITFEVKYDCTKNGTIDSDYKLTMILTGDDVEGQYYLAARHRPEDNKADIGIVVDQKGTRIPMNGGLLVTEDNKSGAIMLQTSPINLVGGELATGDFEATATLKVNIR